MMRYLLPRYAQLALLVPLLFLLSACGPIPVQMSSQSSNQKQSQKQSQENEQKQSQESAQTSSQESAQKQQTGQGTMSQPIIVICNTTNSANSICSPFETAKDVLAKPPIRGGK